MGYRTDIQTSLNVIGNDTFGSTERLISCQRSIVTMAVSRILSEIQRDSGLRDPGHAPSGVNLSCVGYSTCQRLSAYEISSA